jgi:plastocyanin
MGSSEFVGSTSISISAGQTVTFSDPSGSGGIHDLVTGTNGTFAAASGAPSEFATADGVNFSPGDSKSITFATAGTYNITCRIHPPMQATITVS